MLLYSRMLNDFLIFRTFKSINSLIFTNFEFLLYTKTIRFVLGAGHTQSKTLSENQSYFKYE